MKIYNKKNFIIALFLTLLGLVLIILNIIQEFKLKSLITSILCLFLGIGGIIRSLSREMAKEDMINELDERNRLINLKSRSKSFGFTQIISFTLMLILFIAGKVLDDDIFTYVGIGLFFSFIISIIAEFCTSIYYEHKN